MERFLTHLAIERTVSASTQALALNSIVFLYNIYLQQPIGAISVFRRSARQPKLPIVLTANEVRLWVKDIDVNHLHLRILKGKGAKHRLVTLAPELVPALQKQTEQVRLLLEQDLTEKDYPGVWMPDAMARKYPSASKSLSWQNVFPAFKLIFEPGTDFLRRHHYDESALNKLIRTAAHQSKLSQEVTCHTLRHSFATHLLQSGADIRLCSSSSATMMSKPRNLCACIEAVRLWRPQPLQQLGSNVSLSGCMGSLSQRVSAIG